MFATLSLGARRTVRIVANTTAPIVINATRGAAVFMGPVYTNKMFFSAYAKRRDEAMTRSEIETLLQAQSKHELTTDEVDIALKEMDIDGDRHITYDEFLTWCIEQGYQRLNADAEETRSRMHVAKLFDLHDTDSVGHINEKNLGKMFHDLKSNGLYSGSEEDFVAALDKDGDGKIQFKELMIHVADKK